MKVELEISRYHVEGYERLWMERRKQRDGSYKWAIYNNMSNICWDKKLHSFVLEPMNSSKTDEFFENTRFELEEAKAIIEEFFDDPHFVKMAKMLR